MNKELRAPILRLRVDSDMVDEIIVAGYNAKSDDEEDEAFIEAWRAHHNLLETQLSKHWTTGVGEADVYVDGDWTEDRMMCVEISNRRVLNHTFLPIAYDAVSQLNGDFCVDFCDAWGYLETASGEPHPHFNIFVTKKEVWVYTEEEQLLQTLGIAEIIQDPSEPFTSFADRRKSETPD